MTKLRAFVFIATLSLLLHAAQAKDMWVETGDDNWNETLGQDIDPVSGLAKDDAKCSLREAREAWQAARGVAQSSYLHENKLGWQNDCERDGELATGDDTINFIEEVKQVRVDTTKWGSLSLAYIPKTGPSPGFQQVVDMQRLRIQGGVRPGAFFDVTISPAPGSKKSLFVLSGGGSSQNRASSEFDRNLDVTFSGVTFEGARSEESGGVIRAAMNEIAILKVDHSRFLDNDGVPPNAAGEANGGAISSTGGVLSISNSLFRENTATSGGALDLGTGKHQVSDSLFYKNAADRGGGAMSCHGGGKTTIAGSAFELNFVDGESAGPVYHGGGAIDAGCPLTVGGSVFLVNQVIKGGLGGGAIYAAKAGGFTEITNSYFAFNQAGDEKQALSACAGGVEDRCSGGALRLAAEARVDRSLFFGNISYGGTAGSGGAIAADGIGVEMQGSETPQSGVFNSHFSLNKAVYPLPSSETSAGAALAVFGSGRFFAAGNTFQDNRGSSQIAALPLSGGLLGVHLHNDIIVATKPGTLACGGPAGAFHANSDVKGFPIGAATAGGNLQSSDHGAGNCPGVAAYPKDDLLLQAEPHGFFLIAARRLWSIQPESPTVNELGELGAYWSTIQRPKNALGPAFYAGYVGTCGVLGLQRGKDLTGASRPPEACTPGAVEIGGDMN